MKTILKWPGGKEKELPANAIVGGCPAKVIRYKEG